MEPKAIANMNGTLVTPMKNNAQASRDCQSVPNNHVSRRDSTLWMRTPSDRDDDEGLAGEDDWDCDMGSLTPFPMTPAPETVAKFAMDITPQTPTADIGELSGGSLDKDQLLMRTCPPKQSVATDLGRGVLRDDKDQTVMMRLMAARRKSMQFAPKIGSPLAKAWK